MVLVVGSIALVSLLVLLAAVRISWLASWRAVAEVAAATGSLRACVEFIQFCERL